MTNTHVIMRLGVAALPRSGWQPSVKYAIWMSRWNNKPVPVAVMSVYGIKRKPQRRRCHRIRKWPSGDTVRTRPITADIPPKFGHNPLPVKKTTTRTVR